MSLGVYIQVPFCQTKCSYCNFHTGVVSRERYEPYANAVCREILSLLPLRLPGVADLCGKAPAAGDLNNGSDRTVDTIYFGGGTPSLLEPLALARIIDSVRGVFSLSAEPEITLEADPETIDAAKASAWLAAGFNRISLGVQSFNDVELKAAGRMHRRVDVHRATEFLRQAALTNISMDLIAGLPHQTRDSWQASVGETIALRPEHVSIYTLEIDEGSRLGRESIAGGTRYSAAAIPSDDDIAEFYESACERLPIAGYEHYEISNCALPGFRSRHNLKYWRREPYLGFGAGAHSFDGRTRWANIHDAAKYVACIEQGISPREQIEELTPEQALDEEFFTGLRQLDGIDLARIESLYGRNGLRERVAALRARIEGLREQGLVELDGTRLRLAPNRLTVSNEVFVALLD
ncbi:MAG TPA: radical SAM family heme chaperone HemW [Candidatus Acidoferrum sp.]|nr:radical SAM family heme chaperone HemW [Candidatus Acidoferrum sp.]